MLTLPSTVRVYVATQPQDLRKSLDGLSRVVQSVLSAVPTSGHLFCFFNRRANQVRVPFWGGTRWCIFAKRLARGTFRSSSVARGDTPSVCVDLCELTLILQGIDLAGARRRKRFRSPDGQTGNDHRRARRFDHATGVRAPGCSRSRAASGRADRSAGKLSRLTSPSAVALDLTCDGRLTTSATWSGAVSGQLAWAYDADLREIAETVTSGATSSTVRRAYDADSLVICASPSTCTPAARTPWSSPGRPSSRARSGPTSDQRGRRTRTTPSALRRR